MIRILFSLLLAISFQGAAQAVSVEELSKSVVLLRQQQAVEIKDGKQVEIWYRDTASNKFEPKLGGPAGTGFIIRYHGNDYIVTAGHIAKALSLPTAEMIVNITGGKAQISLLTGFRNRKKRMEQGGSIIPRRYLHLSGGLSRPIHC
ncbi:MAG: hypothetical protein WDM70_04900 [Nitrosomonadales bacterium]